METALMEKAEKIAEEEKKKQEEEAKNKKDENESFKKVTGSSSYYIRVNYQANTVTIYTKDSEGNYTVPCKAMVCSCGTWTPKSGTYSTTDKYKWRALVGGVSGKYATRITGQILFHSVPYINQSSDSLEYWEFDKLGTTASLGCVRLQVKDAKWIYDNCGWGTLVEFYGSSNPGPLGKPGAQKISSNEECRDWDPTDPEKGNPWHTYEGEQEEEEEKVKEDKKETNSNKDNNNSSNNTNNNKNNENINNNDTNNETDKENTSENDKQEENKENETEKEDDKTEEIIPEDGKEDSGTEQVPEETEKNENPEENGQEDNNEEELDGTGQGEDGEENNKPETTPTTDTEQAA